jgi:cyclophilin family peptidyl-prolyl cis-trans isomerase
VFRLFIFFVFFIFTQSATSATAQPSVVELQTNLGTIAIELNYIDAPISSNNFIAYVKKGFYKNLLIHRVHKGFVIQGGGINKSDGKLKAPIFPPITLESNNGLKNLTGTVAMARTNAPNSATSQFFINLSDNNFLDYTPGTQDTPSNPGYAVFGEVIGGMDLVRKIEALPNSFNIDGSSRVPFTDSSELVYIDTAYTSKSLDPSVSKTRILISGSGRVTSLPEGIDCGSSCVLSQSVGGTIILTAKSAAGSVFTGWRGDCHGNNSNITLDTTKGNHNCTAVFAKAITEPQ